MTNLPPVGWADVATKHDLDVLAERIGLELEVLKQSIEAMKHEVMANMRAEMVQQTRTMFFGMITSLAAFGGLVLAAVRLLG